MFRPPRRRSTKAHRFVRSDPSRRWELSATVASSERDRAGSVVGCRRRTFERTLRAALVEEPRVTILSGEQVARLLTDPKPTPMPHVTGVRTDNDLDVHGDLVVDATGARTLAASWLERDVNVRPTATSSDSGFTYFTRWCRLRDGARFPTQRRLPYSDGQFATVATFPADDGNFSLIYMAPTAEPLRNALRDASTSGRVLPHFELTAPWLDPGLADPVSDVRLIAGGREQKLDVRVDGRPMLFGLVRLADAARSTNPTRDRGTTMAFLHAQILDLLRSASHDSSAFTNAFAAATERQLVPWFESTVAFGGGAMGRASEVRRAEPRRVEAICSRSSVITSSARQSPRR
jgi:2-polyprenyl-6-methoxyphenol hydroxylase-like FAD-dependent oxidoreductase